MTPTPYKWANKVLNWLIGDSEFDHISGDLLEEFEQDNMQRGLKYARVRHGVTVLRLFRPFLLTRKFRTRLNQLELFNNYLKISGRFMMRHKLFATINIAGLAIGILCSLVLLVYISNELSFDRFNDKADRIYRLLITTTSENNEGTSPIITAAVAPGIASEFPEVEMFVRFSYPQNGFISWETKKINANKIVFTDSALFRVFSLRLLAGDKNTCLHRPYTILLTPSLARSLFKDEDAVGKEVRLNGETSYTVTGIIEEAPVNSQIQYSCLASFATLEKENYFLGWNGGWNYFSYILLRKDANPTLLTEKFPDLMKRNINDLIRDSGFFQTLSLQPLIKGHLGPNLNGDWENKGNMQYIYIFGSISILILLMACINFINLSASQGINRLKEIGVRKSLGAARSVLARQFIAESIFTTIIALLLASIFLIVLYPVVNNFLGFDFDDVYISNLRMGVMIIFLVLIVSTIAGAYPALKLSSLAPSKSLKSSKSGIGSIKSNRLNGIVLIQFLITIILMAVTGYINNQLKYIQNKSLGYDTENRVSILLNSEQSSFNIQLLRNALKEFPEVINVGASTDNPGFGFTSNGYTPEGHDVPMMIHVIDIDEDYLETMNMHVISGRNFSPDILSDKTAYLINSTFVEEMGWQNPIGKTIERDGLHDIIGVVDDFNYASLHEKIQPLIFTMSPWHNQFNFLTINCSTSNISQTLEKIEATWKKINPADPFEFQFMDQAFEDVYHKEQQQAKLLFTFSLMAILIGCMGLIGIVSFSLSQKTKEIGIRKVLGASVITLLFNISRQYLLSVLIAATIALPIVYYVAGKWLNNFYYHIDLTFWIFGLAVVSAIAIALITVNLQTIRAVRQNPVDSLKYE